MKLVLRHLHTTLFVTRVANREREKRESICLFRLECEETVKFSTSVSTDLHRLTLRMSTDSYSHTFTWYATFIGLLHKLHSLTARTLSICW